LISLDANLLFPAYVTDHVNNLRAVEFLKRLSMRSDVVISEFVLTELYGLLRSSTLTDSPLSSQDAVDCIQTYRTHPRWKLCGFSHQSRSLHDRLWQLASEPSFARRRIYDIRFALTLQSFGVRFFAIANVKDFRDLGFERVWNPLLEPGVLEELTQLSAQQ
jgi:uncharacterized protein